LRAKPQREHPLKGTWTAKRNPGAMNDPGWQKKGAKGPIRTFCDRQELMFPVSLSTTTQGGGGGGKKKKKKRRRKREKIPETLSFLRVENS